MESTHHTHIWSLDGEYNVLTTHLVVRPDVNREDMVRIKRETRTAVEDLHLEHLTVELEYSDEDCSQEAAQYHQED